ncbi:MAG TPA: alpha/beta hydrolase [Bacteroidia bacterium]|nr:alpha/beta hydrolase [Bacteroidia bacterium]
MKPLTQKIKIQFIIGAFFTLLLTRGGFAQHEMRSARILQYLLQHQFDSVHSAFNEETKDALSAKRLGLIWSNIERESGELDSTGAPEVELFQDNVTYFQLCRFRKAAYELMLTYDSSGYVNMIRIIPSRPKADYMWPSYAPDAKNYSEIKLTLVNGKYKMPGILTLPVAEKDVPVVIMVHGSGPNDKDETLGNTKLFKDLALGLAAKGIATFRYDKRTKVYGGKSVDDIELLNLDEEVINDAKEAVELMSIQKGINKKEIYVLGHSLGGMCAPRIATNNKKVKGIIMMAANARPLEVLVEEQLHYIFMLNDTLSSEEEEKLNNYKASTAILKDSVRLALASPDELPLGLPTAYWVDLMHYNQVATAGKLNKKILLLQGARDYQVTIKDFTIWENKLKKIWRNIQLILYPNLNHAFTESPEKSSPKDYEIRANVPNYVINNIAEWIKKD